MLSKALSQRIFLVSGRVHKGTLLAGIFAGLLASVVAVLIATAAPAFATSYAYSELARFGGFDSAAYNNGHYGGSLTSGKFVDPTGFAVDTEYRNAMGDLKGETEFVVDRTSGTSGTTTNWRLQEFAGNDTAIGSTTFTLPNERDTKSGVVGLAVDPQAGRVYALIVGENEDPNLESEVPFAKELVAWSVVPESEKLVAAKEGSNALPADSLGSTGGVVSTEAQLTENGMRYLYAPQGIALDVTGQAGNIAIEASSGAKGESTGVPGVALVQQVSTEGAKRGALLSEWSASSLTKPTNEDSAGPRGISTDPDGSLNVLLGSVEGGDSNVDVVKLSADLSSAQQLLDSENTSLFTDLSPANLASAPGASGVYAAQSTGAGPGLVQLAGGEGVYAATYERDASTDPDSPELTNYYWTDATPSLGGIANVGLRLLLPNAGGEISDTKGGTIVNTVGYAKIVKEAVQPGGVCNLDGEEEALAAGANGTLWVLGRGFDTEAVASEGGLGATVGREIVEFGPGGGGANACPQPSGTFTLSKPEVSEGATVEFNAATVDLQHGVPFAYEWAPTGEGFTIVKEIGLWPRELVEEPSWPPATASYKYTQSGKYMVKLRIRSDYGTYEAPAQALTVTSANLPVAKFGVATSEPTAGQPVTFNVSESSAPSGDSISDYRWEWGDGSKPEEDQSSGPTFVHTFAAPATYTVKLVVTDSEELQSEVFSENVTVAGGEKTTTTTPTTTTPTTTTPTITTPTTTTKSETPPPKETTKKPLTNTQKLAAALKACKKKPKKQRASCEKQAKKRYAPPKKKSKKKKK
jgi:PKD repeat protein